MKDLKSVLFVGPLTPPITGQAFAFEAAYSNYTGRKYVVSQNFEELNNYKKIVPTIISIAKIFFFLIFRNIDVVYFTGSRTLNGAMKDFFLITLSKILKKK